MATYTLIEFNGDHIVDIIGKGDELGPLLRNCISNPFNAPDLLERHGYDRAIRVISQNGDPIRESHTSHHLWLNPGVKRRPVNPDLMDIIADLEAFNTNQSMSGTLQEIIGRLRKVIA
jgi:hypothetical protein